MELTEAQYRQIERCLPTQRGNVVLENLQVLNAILYVAAHGCTWRGRPKQLGNWHTIYTRMNRWAKRGVLDRVFTQWQQAQIIRVKIEAVALDSTIVKVHPDGTGALKKRPARHRPISRRMDHHDASGCRGCSNGPDVGPVAGPRPRCARRAQAAAALRETARPSPLIDGSRVGRR